METEAQFTSLLINALREAGVQYDFEAGEGVEIFAVEDGVRTLCFFGQRAYEKYREDPSSREDQLSLLVSMVKQCADSSSRSPVLSKLVPLLRSREWLERVGKNRPFAALPGGPVMVLAEDQGDRIRHLQSKDLAKLAQPFRELVSIAVGNLRTIAPIRQENLGSVLMLVSGGDYEASLALDGKLISDISDSFGCDVIFAMPTTDVFLIGRKEQAALESLARAVGGQIRDKQEVLSTNIYHHYEGELTPFAEVEVVEGRITVSVLEG